MKEKLIKLSKQIRGLIPESLPVGMTEFDNWANSFLKLYDLPTKDLDSVRFTLSTILMHLGAQTAYKSKMFFVLTMKAAAAKQIAGAVFYEIKEKQKAAAALAAKEESAATSNAKE